MTTPTPRLHCFGGDLDPAPFVALVKRDLEILLHDGGSDSEHGIGRGRMGIVAAHGGINPRVLHRIMSGEAAAVSLDVVDRYCCRTDRHIRDLYPHLYEDAQVDADCDERDRLNLRSRKRSYRSENSRLARLRRAAA